MRKLAPVFFSSILVVTSGTALALGDMHKNKKAPSTDNTSQTYTTPSSKSSTGSAADTSANPNAVAPSPGSSSYDSINKDSTSPSANSGAAMSDNGSMASDQPKAKTPGNAKSTPDAKIQRDNDGETNNPTSAPPSTPKMSGVATGRSGFVKTAYGTSDKGTVASDDNSGYTKKKQIARNDDRCDQTLPKDCVEHAGTGAAATNDTQGQSGGAGSGAGSAGGASGAAGGAAGSAGGAAGSAGGAAGAAGGAAGSAGGAAGAGSSSAGSAAGSGSASSSAK